MIYIDNDFKCYTTASEDRRALETDFFDGKCGEFIEGYRCIPEGETWISSDGEEFRGEMMSPWKPYTELYIAQLEYELADADSALAELGVTFDA